LKSAGRSGALLYGAALACAMRIAGLCQWALYFLLTRRCPRLVRLCALPGRRTERLVAKEPKEKRPSAYRLPLLALKDAVVFPNTQVPLLVGRAASLNAVEEAVATEHPIFLCTQIDPTVEDPVARDLYALGVVAHVRQTLRMADGTMKVVVEGLGRAWARRFYLERDVPEALVEKLVAPVPEGTELEGTLRAVLGQFEEYARQSQRIAPEIVATVMSMTDPDLATDTVCAHLPLKVAERQELLEQVALHARLDMILAILMRENELLGIEGKVRERVREQMERGQREHYLHEQLKAIHQELGNREDAVDEFTEMRQLIAKVKMPKEINAKAMREFGRYERMPVMSPEGAVIRTYLEWLCDMPWKKLSKEPKDLKNARAILDRDHFGLEKVKERILEFLAVRMLSDSAKGPILCLVGPPGVGKTSLGNSIAEAMGRKFVRMSLGGVRDEAEIRGHRRTYIGALPGRIIQGLKKAGVRNPVFMLDEIDKMSTDFRGDPSSALLEVLDPSQNKHFSDHYLKVEFDLSDVFFIATANNEFDIPYALHDRMEVVRLSGYTLHEKEHIARLFLMPRQVKDSGLKAGDVEITDDGLDTIIQRYTREAGVRELDRQIANVFRKTALRVVESGRNGTLTVDRDMAFTLLGPPPYSAIRSETEAHTGVAIGMAWTQSGGDVLTIETIMMKGKGKLSLTGQLGNVMKESAEAAFTFLRANAKQLGVSAEIFKTADIHVHVPEGAIPKDGPSAGVALITSMLSALSGKPPIGGLSMTGEITLLGRVLPVGGIKEKVLAAHRAGIRKVILPKENEKDLPEIPADVREEVAFTLVEHVSEVVLLAFGIKMKAEG